MSTFLQDTSSKNLRKSPGKLMRWCLSLERLQALLKKNSITDVQPFYEKCIFGTVQNSFFDSKKITVIKNKLLKYFRGTWVPNDFG